jgi:N-acetylneuraminate synthase
MFKIGSGDITWPEMPRKIASKNKPVLLVCGA